MASKWRWQYGWEIRLRSEDAPSRGTWYVAIGWNRWKHIADKHVADRSEPWDDWLGQASVGKLRRVRELPTEERKELLNECTKLLEKSVIRSAARPLFMQMNRVEHRASGRSGCRSVVFVLPEGAVCCAGVIGRVQWHVRTVFFPVRRRQVPLARVRWRETVRRMVVRYGRPGKQAGRLELPDEQYTKRLPEATVSQIRFVAAREWGFESDAPRARWRPQHLRNWPIG